MTVAELIEALKNLDPDMKVVLQKDSEGNGYSPLDGADTGLYVADSTWSGEVYPDDEEPDEEDEWLKEELEKAEKVAVLWPVN